MSIDAAADCRRGTHGINYDSCRSSAHLEANGALAGSADESSEDCVGHITVVLGRFDALVGRGLRQILLEDRRIRLIDADLNAAYPYRAARPKAVGEQAEIRSGMTTLGICRPVAGVLGSARLDQRLGPPPA